MTQVGVSYEPGIDRSFMFPWMGSWVDGVLIGLPPVLPDNKVFPKTEDRLSYDFIPEHNMDHRIRTWTEHVVSTR